MIIQVPLNKIKQNPYQPDSRLSVDKDTARRFGISFLEIGLILTPVAREQTILKDVTTLFNENETITEKTGYYELADGWLRFNGFEYLFTLPEEEYKLLAEEAQKRLDTAGNNRKVPSQAEFQTMPLDVRELSDRQMADMIFEANEIRKNLSPIDRAKFFKRYLEDFKVTQAEVAESHNISQGELANTIRLLELPEDIQQKLISQEINETTARQLLRLNYDPKLQQEILTDAIKHQYTIDQLSNYIAQQMYHKSRNLEPSYNGGEAPIFDITQCKECPYRQKIGQPYSNSSKSLRCLNPDCWDKKQIQALDEKQAELIAANKSTPEDVRILTRKDIAYNQKEDLNDSALQQIDSPSDCMTCEKTALFRWDETTNPFRVCLNPACFRAKKSKKTKEEHTLEKKKDQQLTARLGETFNKLGEGPFDNHLCLIVMARYVLQGLNADGLADMTNYFPGLSQTLKKRIDIQALIKTLPQMSVENLIKICAAAVITHGWRQYSGGLSPKLKDNTRMDYAILTGKLNEHLNQVKAFQKANCRGCNYSNPEKVGTGDECCTHTYYKDVDDNGKCKGRKTSGEPVEDEEDEAAIDLGEHSEEDDCEFDCAKCGKKDCQAYGLDQGWKCRICGCIDDHGCVTEDGVCRWVEPNLCSACKAKETVKPKQDESPILISQDELKKILQSNSSDLMEKGKIRQPYKYGDKLYTIVGGLSRGVIDYEAEGWPLVLKSEYKGETSKYNDPLKPRGDFSGLVVKYKVDYVITGPATIFKDPNAEETWKNNYPDLAEPEKHQQIDPEPSKPNQIDFNTLECKTAPKEGELHIMTCSGKRAEGENLRETAVGLCRELGIKFTHPSDLVQILKADFPDSTNRDLYDTQKDIAWKIN